MPSDKPSFTCQVGGGSWIEAFNASRNPENYKFQVIGKCVYCGGDATLSHCRLLSPTTKSPSIKICQDCLTRALCNEPIPKLVPQGS